MERLRAEALALQQQVDDALVRLKLSQLETELASLRQRSLKPDFWQDNQAAQQIMQQIAKLETRVNPWRELADGVHEVVDIIGLNVEGSEPEISKQLAFLTAKFDDYKQQLKFGGPYDDHDAILSIHAGAGGADAQDWANMLLRMYVRYAEKEGWQVATVEESPGENPNTIKSIVLEITGAFAYGKLKGEHGVHRLVRLSPFNAESRETSFAKVEVTPKIDAPEELEIDDKDLKIDVYRSGGHGGQSVNTTDSAVRVTHLPTGIVVAIQNERSQLQNKEMAMQILRGKLVQLQAEQHAEKVSELKGPNEQAAWGNQIRSYVLHPYKQVKDLRTGHTSTDPDDVLDGNLDPFVTAYLEYAIGT